MTMQPFIFFDFPLRRKRWCWHVCFDVHWFVNFHSFLFWTLGILLAQDLEIFLEGILPGKLANDDFSVSSFADCRRTSAKYPLLLCFTATDWSQRKKSKAKRAWRPRTDLLSTLCSNDWLGPGPVWPFYYFDAIFMLLQGSRIGPMDKCSKMQNLGLLSICIGRVRDRPSVQYTFQTTQLGFVLAGFQSFGQASRSRPQSEYNLWLSSKRWLQRWMRAMGTISQGFSCTSRPRMIGSRFEFEEIGWWTGCDAPYFCCCLHRNHQHSEYVFEIWNVLSSVQRETDDSCSFRLWWN